MKRVVRKRMKSQKSQSHLKVGTYRYDPKFSDSQVGANSGDPDQTGGAV